MVGISQPGARPRRRGLLLPFLVLRRGREHVTLENGKKFDPEDVSMDQLLRLIAELTLPEEGRGISDFIGLLC